MPVKLFLSELFLFLFTQNIQSQKAKSFSLTSPDGKIAVNISVTDNVKWSVNHNGDVVILPSAISIELQLSLIHI